MGNINVVTLMLWILCMSVREVLLQDCNGNDEFGENGVDSKDLQGVTDNYFFTCSGQYAFGCCGVIEEWTFETEAAGSVELLVWRKISGTASTYEVVSSQTVGATDGKQTVTASSRYLVTTDSCLGWFTSGTDVLGSKDGNNAVGLLLPTGSVTRTGTDWDPTSATSVSAEWAIEGKLEPPADPTSNGPVTAPPVSDAETNGYSVGTITFNDQDFSDVLTITMPGNAYFDLFDYSNGTAEIKVGSNIGDLSATTVTLTITAEDLCGGTVTETFTFDVTNTPPVIAGNAVSVDLSEDNPTLTNLTTFTCSDTSGYNVANYTVVPNNDPSFFIVKQTGANDFVVTAQAQTDPTNRFNYNTDPIHTITLYCCDRVECVTSTVTVYLQPNNPPIINNLPDTAVVNITWNVGTVVFNLSFSDVEGDTMNAWGDCDPSNCPAVCPFTVLDDGGVILNTALDDTFVQCDLFVYLWDSKNNGTQKTLSIESTGRNNRPVFLNLENTITVGDGTAMGTSLFTVLGSDADGDTYYFQWYSADNGESFFTLNADGTVTTASLINYETLPQAQYLFTVTVTDTKGASSTSTLTVKILDANEPFAFSSSVYRGNIVEWAAVGTTLTDIVFTIIDDDVTDSHTCTLDCSPYDGYFAITTSCSMYVGSLYKLDDLLPTSIPCIVSAEDSGGNTGTTSVVITIEYDNNFTPTFNQTIYDFIDDVSTTSTANSDVGYVFATDSDASTYGQFTYSLTPTNLSRNFFKIDESTGLIRTRVAMASCNCAGETIYMTVYATDTGGRNSSAQVMILVNEIPVVDIEDRYKKFFDDERNIAWFSLLILLLTITLVVTVFVCVKYVCMKPCKNPFGRRYGWRPRYVDRQERPPSPRPAKPRHTEFHTVRKHPPDGHSWQRTGGLY